MTTAELTPSPETPSPSRRLSPGRGLIALAGFAGVALVMLAAPPEIQPLVLALLVISMVISLALVYKRENLATVEFSTVLRNWQRLPGIIRALTVTALVIMGIAAYLMRPQIGSEVVVGFPVFLLGVAAIGLALGLTIFLQPRDVSPAEPLYRRVDRLRDLIATGKLSLLRVLSRLWQDQAQARPIRWHAVFIGCGMMLFLMQINVLTEFNALFWMRWMLDFSHHLQMILLVGGSGLVAWGLAGRSLDAKKYPNAGDESGRSTLRPYAKISHYAGEIRVALRDRHVQLFVLVMAIATFARLWDLELWSTRFLDELHYMNAAARLVSTGNQQILTPFSQVTAFTWLYPYFQAGITLLTGPSFTGVRLLSALVGIAQVAAVYVLGRQVFDRRTGLIAALVLATLPAHVHFSRIGINNIADPLFGILALAFLSRGLRTGKQTDFALAGWCLGWTQYFYEGGRLFYPLFIVCWLGWMFLFMRRGGKYRFPTPRNLLVFGFSAIVLILPVYYVIFSREIILAPRFTEMRDVGQAERLDDEELSFQDRVQPVLDKLQLPLRALVEQPDLSWFYGAQVGYVMPVLVPIFLLGMAHCFWRLRSPGGSLVFWWIIAASTGIALISDALSSPRYLVMMPAIALAIAAGITKSLELVAARRITSNEDVRATQAAPLQRNQKVILALVVVLIAVAQGGYYALTLMPRFYLDRVYYAVRDEHGDPFPDTDDALVRSVSLPPNTDVLIITPNLIWTFNSDTVPMYWHRPDLVIRHRFKEDVTSFYLQNLPRFRNQVFFVEQDDTATLARIQKYFTFSDDPTLSGVLSPYRIPVDVQLVQYFAPASQERERLDEVAVPPEVTPIRSADDVDE